MAQFQPAYVKTWESGELARRADAARKRLTACDLCPRKCGVDRLSGETGFCGIAEDAVVSSHGPHFGEEAPLVGENGSGTIFFAGCNLLCNFCQNFDISHGVQGRPASAGDLADMMLELEAMGCHNINFVTPSHVVPQILSALEIAAEKGLRVPLVYNTGGYDRVSTLQLLDGVFDIYMPDFKFWDESIARRACRAPDYAAVAKKAVKEMYAQAGDLTLDEHGRAMRGVLVRHLVLPENLAGTRRVMEFLAQEVSARTYVNIMPQYRPLGNAREIPELARTITRKEYEAALDMAMEAGITRLDRRPRFFLV